MPACDRYEVLGFARDIGAWWHGIQRRRGRVGKGLVWPVVEQRTAGSGSLHGAVVRMYGTGNRDKYDEEHRQIDLFHGSTCEVGLLAFPQGL